MSHILVVLEHRNGQFNRMSWEALAAAEQLAAAHSLPVHAAVLTDSAAPLTSELTSKKLAKTIAIEHPLLKLYTADGYSLALQQLITSTNPAFVLFPHTYQVRDFAPALATRLNQTLISDVTAIHPGPVFVRQLMQGKLNADYKHSGTGPCLVSVQAGAFRADQLEPGTATLETFTPTLDAAQIRNTPGEPFRESTQTVDLTAAPIIVSVGRGIREEANLPIIQELAAALNAEIAASRPICDNGWLPMERQVGSSGQTVAPKLYLAVGISGAIQHLVGMKGSKTIVAINKDENAPIFELADFGIVGDLFEVVPALTKAITAAKA